MFRKNASNPVAGQQNPLPFNPIEDADISKSTNRLTTNTVYDEAGNVIQDNKFRSMNYAYDANGRMFKTSNTNNSNQANSVYDASGQRVATQVDGVWTFFVYDAMGKMVAEYGGLPSSDEGGVKYVMQDWQGSTRAIVNNSGFVQSRMDYTAFGEEINSGVGQRTTAQGFGANNNLNQKYAQTERDKATGLDHTGFRKNENRAGRWTSPDPYNGSMSLGNPQSFNRYSYVQNDPVNNVDPSGLDMSMCSAEYSYGSCGGDDAFWGGRSNGGGGFGGGYADYNQTYGGLPAGAAQGLADHLERVNNSIYGNGFRTAAEIAYEVGLIAIVNVYWTATANGFEWAFQKPELIWRGGEQNRDRFPHGDGITMLDPIDHMALAGLLESLIKGLLGGLAKAGAAEVAAEQVPNVVREGNLANHLFKGAGKLADNPANRTLIENISNGKALVVDKFGKSWYRGVDAAGNGIYSYTQNGIVKGAGYTNLSAAEMIIKYGVK